LEGKPSRSVTKQHQGNSASHSFGGIDVFLAAVAKARRFTYVSGGMQQRVILYSRRRFV